MAFIQLQKNAQKSSRPTKSQLAMKHDVKQAVRCFCMLNTYFNVVYPQVRRAKARASERMDPVGSSAKKFASRYPRNVGGHKLLYITIYI